MSYPTDMTDAEWALIASELPVPACQTRSGGRPEKHDRRVVVNAIRYVTDNGTKWRALPCDFGVPWQTVYGFFRRRATLQVAEKLRDLLRRKIRTRSDRCPNAVSLMIDSQSVKASETVGKDTRGFDGAKLINGRKRHLVVDGGGLPVDVMVTAADIGDRPAAKLLLKRLHDAHPEVVVVYADSGYSGEDFIGWARENLGIRVIVVKRPKNAKGFVLLPKRWVVERTFGWIMRARRNVRDHEGLPEHS